MEVILLEKIANLGALGDRVTVKAGYGRNYLIPQAKAVAATADNIEAFESRRAELEKEAAQILSAAEARATADGKNLPRRQLTAVVPISSEEVAILRGVQQRERVCARLSVP